MGHLLWTALEESASACKSQVRACPQAGQLNGQRVAIVSYRIAKEDLRKNGNQTSGYFKMELILKKSELSNPKQRL